MTTELGPELREELGREVRRVWLIWVRTNPSISAKRPASWEAEWNDLKEEDKEVDRMIGEAIYLKTKARLCPK